MRPLRLLLLNWRDPTNPFAGGAESHVWKVFAPSSAHPHEVCAITAGFPCAPKSESVGGVSVTRCGSERTYPLLLPCAYRNLARSFQPDLVIEFLNKIPLYAPIYVRRPIACFVHHLFGTAASLECSELTAGVIRLAETAVPQVYSRVAFLTGSHSSKTELVQRGIPDEQITVIPYGVDVESYSIGQKAILPTLLYVGRLKRYKQVDHLIQIVPAMKKLFPQLRVHILGIGDQELPLRELAARLGVASCVHFHGFVSEQEKQALLASAWLNIFPSVKEGFGLTVPEAALCGTPTVGYDVPGLRDAIVPDKTGALVPGNDLLALRDKVVHLLRDTAARKRMADAGILHYKDFTWSAAAERTFRALEHSCLGQTYSTAAMAANG